MAFDSTICSASERLFLHIAKLDLPAPAMHHLLEEFLEGFLGQEEDLVPYHITLQDSKGDKAGTMTLQFNR